MSERMFGGLGIVAAAALASIGVSGAVSLRSRRWRFEALPPRAPGEIVSVSAVAEPLSRRAARRARGRARAAARSN